jgi:hypothetical protein
MKIGPVNLLNSFNRAECEFFGGIITYIVWKIRLRFFRPKMVNKTPLPEMTPDDPRRLYFEIKTSSGYIPIPYPKKENESS